MGGQPILLGQNLPKTAWNEENWTKGVGSKFYYVDPPPNCYIFIEFPPSPKNERNVLPYQWRIQDFPEVGTPTLEGDNILFWQISQKLHDIERIWTRRGVPRALLDPPLHMSPSGKSWIRTVHFGNTLQVTVLDPQLRTPAKIMIQVQIFIDSSRSQFEPLKSATKCLTRIFHLQLTKWVNHKKWSIYQQSKGKLLFTVSNSSCGKAMFFTGVCLSTGGGGVYIPWADTPSRQTPPLGRHLLTSYQPAWHPGRFDPYTCTRTIIGCLTVIVLGEPCFWWDCRKIGVNTTGPESIKWWHHKFVSHQVMTLLMCVQSESSICWEVSQHHEYSLKTSCDIINFCLSSKNISFHLDCFSQLL